MWEYSFGPLLAGVEGMGINLDETSLPVDPDPLELADRTILPGCEVVYMGGLKTSAGFPSIHMEAPAYLVYEGMINSLEGRLAIFRTEGNGLDPEGWRFAYWYYKGHALIFCSPAVSGRTIELTHWKTGRYLKNCPCRVCECHKEGDQHYPL